MSWHRPLLATMSGAAITLGSTAVSCGLALQVEKSANRALYWWSPELFAKVDQAYGITPEQLQHARQLAARQFSMHQTDQFIAKDKWAYEVEDEDEDEEEDSVPWQVPIPEITKQRLGLVHTAAATTARATILTTLCHHEVVACSMTG